MALDPSNNSNAKDKDITLLNLPAYRAQNRPHGSLDELFEVQSKHRVGKFHEHSSLRTVFTKDMLEKQLDLVTITVEVDERKQKRDKDGNRANTGYVHRTATKTDNLEGQFKRTIMYLEKMMQTYGVKDLDEMLELWE